MLYWIARPLIALYMIIFHRIRIEGRENIPESGPVLLFSNHPSAFDMFLLAGRIRRKIHFMGKAELFRNPVFAILIRSLGAFPVSRGKGDVGSIKYAIRLLERGEVVGIFPEGTRTLKKNTERKRGGAALLAFHTDAPVLPVAISGRYRIFSRMRIVFGEPFRPMNTGTGKPDREELNAVTTDILNRIYALIDQ